MRQKEPNNALEFATYSNFHHGTNDSRNSRKSRGINSKYSDYIGMHFIFKSYHNYIFINIYRSQKN